MRPWLRIRAVLATALPLLAAAASAQPPDPRLDFWVGDWEVHLAGTQVRDGHDRVEKVVGGNAVVEHWSDANGHQGQSWFYYSRPEKRWKQVWVTDFGQVKEKAMVDAPPGAATRFCGAIPRRDGTTVLDQTTLTQLPDGTLRQVIESSEDGGKTWTVAYDAIYTRGLAPAAAAASLAASRPLPPESHQFDFWIGEWNVFDAQGKPAGQSRIESMAEGGGILENWTDADGTTGKSLNVYNAPKQRWQQFWVGSGTPVLEMSGGLVKGSMVLTGDRTGKGGAKVIDRFIWTPREDGSVRQHWEVSADGGQTWHETFDGIYRRKE